MRVTRLDDCGNFPDPETECSFVVSDGFVSVSVSANTEDGTDITQTNANGDLCISDRSRDQLRMFDLEIEFCQVDPELFEMVTHSQIVEDDTAEAVGFELLEGASTENYALELWAGVPGEDCPPDAEILLGYLLIPWVVPGAIGDFTIENDAVTFTVAGFTKSGGNWGVGPYDVVDDGTGTAGPLLLPIGSDVHLHLQQTTFDAPEAVCGCQAMPAAGV